MLLPYNLKKNLPCSFKEGAFIFVTSIVKICFDIIIVNKKIKFYFKNLIYRFLFKKIFNKIIFEVISKDKFCSKFLLKKPF